MATKPWDAPITGSMFGGAAPTPVYTPTPYGGYGPSSKEIEDAMRSGTYYAPEGSPNPLAPGSNINEQIGTSGPDWLGKGLEALNKALAYKGQASTTRSSGYRGYGSNAPTAVQGRGYTMFMPTPTQKTTQSGGSRGIGGALGTLAGIGVSMIPGVGAAAAAAAPAAGGALGSLFG